MWMSIKVLPEEGQLIEVLHKQSDLPNGEVMYDSMVTDFGLLADKECNVFDLFEGNAVAWRASTRPSKEELAKLIAENEG